MAIDWESFKARRAREVREQGQYVGILDKDWNPVMDIEDWESAEWGGAFLEVGSMQMVLPGSLSDGSPNPVVEYLISADVADFNEPSRLDRMFHEGVHIMVEREGARRVYRVLDVAPEGGRSTPNFVTVTGVELLEHLKHLPLWADPSNHSKVVQLSFNDRQAGSVEEVSRKLIMRNLHGYQQPSLLANMLSWTNHTTDVGHWRSVNPDMHAVMCSPIPSGVPSEECIVEARWDNAWDLLLPSWQAAGVMPRARLWLPGDAQPFPNHTTLNLPTLIVDFKPCSTVSGAVGLIGQGWRALQRKIDSDGFSSAIDFSTTEIPTDDGRLPWVVFDFEEAPKVTIRKSTDSRFLVGGKSPKIVNEVVKAGIKSAAAMIVAAIPLVGPVAAEAIRGGVDIAANLTPDKFLNLDEHRDSQRAAWHGRSKFISLFKAGEANSLDSLQKAWQAKTETNGGLSVEFTMDSTGPYTPHRDFEIGDTVGITAWGQVWAAYLSDLTWTSEPGEPVAFTLRLGDLAAIKDPEALFQQNVEVVRGVISRLSTAVNN